MKNFVYTLALLASFVMRAEAVQTITSSPCDIVVGDPNAPIKIYEFSSMTCDHCAEFHSKALPAIKAKYIDTGKAVLIFKHFPMDVFGATAAMVVTSLPASERFEALNTLYATQKKWITPHYLKEISAICKVDPKKVSDLINNKESREQIFKIRLEAEKELKVDATPTFFINGKKVEGSLPLKEFDKLISEAAKKPV